jgi:hypothetical protein
MLQQHGGDQMWHHALYCCSTVQGNCTQAPPSVSDAPPLAPLREGQCLLVTRHDLFVWQDLVPSNVWLHNLYVRSPAGTDDVGTVIYWRPTSVGARLWLSAVTLQGADLGLVAEQEAYASGTFRHQHALRVDVMER